MNSDHELRAMNQRGIEALEEKKIVQKMLTDLRGNTIYELSDVHAWDCGKYR